MDGRIWALGMLIQRSIAISEQTLSYEVFLLFRSGVSKFQCDIGHRADRGAEYVGKGLSAKIQGMEPHSQGVLVAQGEQ